MWFLFNIFIIIFIFCFQISVPPINDSNYGNSSYAKTKASIASFWNNVKYEVQKKFRTKFNFDSPICLLGQFYHIKMSDSIESEEKDNSFYVYEKFKHDFYSRIWITYRRHFSQLPETSITDDTGWGCMVRSGQMILAQALSLHFLGRNWRWIGPHSKQDETIHRMLINWFVENPNSRISPFSIHQFVKLGEKLGKKAGDWFGPATISYVIKSALEKCKDDEYLKDICCYVAPDCTVYMQDVLNMCGTDHGNNNTNWRSVLILVPVRLGGDSFNSVYSSYVQQILTWPCCLGIIGGQPRHSLYFVGFQNDKLIYLDPHTTQTSIDLTDANFSLDSFHCHTPRKVSIFSIDPSCSIGFYIKTKQDFDEFIKCTEDLLESTRQAGDYPIFVLNTGTNVQNETLEMPEKILRMKYRIVDSKGNLQKVIKTEDFVLL